MRRAALPAIGIMVAVAMPAGTAGVSAATLRGTVIITERNEAPGDPSRAVVWVEGAAAAGEPATRAEIVMKNKTFEPGLVVVAAGSTVSFPNADPILHNVFSVSGENRFDLGLYGRGGGREVVLRQPGVVRVYCNVHPKMEAFVVVTSGAAARVHPDGTFEIAGVPAGRYELVVWDERGGRASQPVEVAGETVSVSFRLDASQYHPRPHLDKDGRPYTGRDRY